MPRHMKSARIRRAAAAVSLAVCSLVAVLVAPTPASGQVLQLLQAVNNGGSWIRLPVEAGQATYRSPVFPLAGLAVDGCLKVWERHSGSWTIRAHDTMGDDRLDVTATPGEPVKFAYKAGIQAQLDVAIEWSEPADTTLFIWVGISASGNRDNGRDICQPPPT